MIRALLDILLPMAVPSLLWLVRLTWRQWRSNGRLVPDWQLVPWTWLLTAGMALTLVLLLGGALLDNMATGRYVPAQLDDHGRLVPGYFK